MRQEMTPHSGTDLCAQIERWIVDACEKLSTNSFNSESLTELKHILGASGSLVPRQRLLYLHAAAPSIHAGLVGGVLHEPVKGHLPQIDPLAPEIPFACVHDALLDGWRVVHFPQQLAPYSDREIDLIGFEFILEKMEVGIVGTE